MGYVLKTLENFSFPSSSGPEDTNPDLNLLARIFTGPASSGRVKADPRTPPPFQPCTKGTKAGNSDMSLVKTSTWPVNEHEKLSSIISHYGHAYQTTVTCHFITHGIATIRKKQRAGEMAQCLNAFAIHG